MKKLYLQALFLAALLAPVLNVAPVEAKAKKTDICHYAGPHGKVVYINVSDNAVAAHFAHGDDLFIDGACGDGDGNGGEEPGSDGVPACLLGRAFASFDVEAKGTFDIDSWTFTGLDASVQVAYTAQVSIIDAPSNLAELVVGVTGEDDPMDFTYSDNWSANTSGSGNLTTTGLFLNDAGSSYSIVRVNGDGTCARENTE